MTESQKFFYGIYCFRNRVKNLFFFNYHQQTKSNQNTSKFSFIYQKLTTSPKSDLMSHSNKCCLLMKDLKPTEYNYENKLNYSIISKTDLMTLKGDAN